VSDASTDSVIEVKDLVKRFGAFTAVDQVSFSIRRGEIFGFLGPNGAGKTTTMRMACGLLTPTSGSGTVAGFDILTESEQIKRRLGYMSQRFSLYPDLTVAENLEFYAGIYEVSAAAFSRRRAEVLESVGLLGYEGRLAANLSVGYRQRLGLACAVIHQPPVLFLDEPTSGVDPVSRRMFWDLIDQRASQGVTVLVTTHVMEEAEFCQRLVMIYRGRRIALGAPAELRGSYPGVILSLQAEPLLKALTFLRGHPAVDEAALFGHSLHFSVASAEADPARWQQRLTAAGIDVQALEVSPPSMEDVFVALVAEEDREAATGRTPAHATAPASPPPHSPPEAPGS